MARGKVMVKKQRMMICDGNYVVNYWVEFGQPDTEITKGGIHEILVYIYFADNFYNGS
jgi:hypothetical protein